MHLISLSFPFSLIGMMDSLAMVKYKIVITMAMITIFHIFFKSNVILPGFVHITLFISYHLVISSIFALLKLEALLGCGLRGELGLTGQPPWGDACLLTSMLSPELQACKPPAANVHFTCRHILLGQT